MAAAAMQKRLKGILACLAMNPKAPSIMACMITAPQKRTRNQLPQTRNSSA